MARRLPGPILPAVRPKRKKIIPLLIIVAILTVGVFIYEHNHKKVSSDHLTTAKEIQNNSTFQKINKGYLAQKDYGQYQAQVVSIASQYENHKDYVNAAKTMDQVFTNVPADQITASTYYEAITIANAQHDTAKKSQYVKSLVDLLNKEGQTDEAAAVQKSFGS